MSKEITDYPQFKKMARELVAEFSCNECEGLDEEEAEHDTEQMVFAAVCVIDDVFYWGAAVAFGLMGMAEAIRATKCAAGAHPWLRNNVCTKCGGAVPSPVNA